MWMIKATVFAAIMALAPSGGHAAAINVADYNYEVEGEVARYGLADVSVTEDPVVPGVFSLSAIEPSFLLLVDSFDLADPSQASFVLFGPDLGLDELSANGAKAQGDMTGGLQFLFGGVLGQGVYAPFDGGSVLVTVSAEGLVPDAEFFAFGEGTITVDSLRIITAIPVPSASILLVTGLGALALARRRIRDRAGRERGRIRRLM